MFNSGNSTASDFEDFESTLSSNEEYLSDQCDEDLNKLSPDEITLFPKEVFEKAVEVLKPNDTTVSRVVHLNADVPEFIPRSVQTVTMEMSESQSKDSQEAQQKSSQTAKTETVDKAVQTKIKFNNASVQTDKSNPFQFKLGDLKDIGGYFPAIQLNMFASYSMMSTYDNLFSSLNSMKNPISNRLSNTIIEHLEDEEVVNERDRDLRIDMLLDENRKLYEKIENLQEKIKDHSLQTKQQVLTAEHYASINASINAIKLEAHKENLEDKITLLKTKIDQQNDKLCEQEKNNQMLQSLIITQTVQYLDFQRDVILRHLRKCKVMTNDLTTALPTLSISTCPTANDCRLQADQWRFELEKAERCLTSFEDYSDQVMNCIYTCNFNNVPKAPKEIKFLTEYKNILHDNFLQAVTSLLNEKFFYQQQYQRQQSQWINNYERSVAPPRFQPIAYAGAEVAATSLAETPMAETPMVESTEAVESDQLQFAVLTGIPHPLPYLEPTRVAVAGNPTMYIPPKMPKSNKSMMPTNYNEACMTPPNYNDPYLLSRNQGTVLTSHSNKPAEEINKLDQLSKKHDSSESNIEQLEPTALPWEEQLKTDLLKEASEDLPAKETLSIFETLANSDDPHPSPLEDEDNKNSDLLYKEQVCNEDVETLDLLHVEEKDENNSEQEDSIDNNQTVVQDKHENNASGETLPEGKIRLIPPHEYGSEPHASAANFFLGPPMKYQPSNSNNDHFEQSKQNQGEIYESGSVSSNSNNQSKDTYADLPEAIRKLSNGFCNLFIYVRDNIPERDQMEIFSSLKRVRRSMGGLSGKTRETILSHVKQDLLSDSYDCRSEASSGNQLPVCVVCLNTATVKESIILPCSHPFHGKCIAEWFSKNLGCPACQQ